MEKRHRIFIAINLPAEIKKELAFYAEKWPELPAKWVSGDNLHITLIFLGDLTDVELADACEAVKKVSEIHKSFSINLNKIVYGPPKKLPPRFVWVSGSSLTNFESDGRQQSGAIKDSKLVRDKKSEELSDLKNDLEELLLEKITFKPEGRGFAPHITLARIQEWAFRQIEPEERPEINEDIDLMFTAESIEVMESELRRTGPEYIVIESHNLNN